MIRYPGSNVTQWMAAALLLLPLGMATAPSASAQAATGSVVTQFKCVSSGSNFATIATRGTRKTPPMILWTKSQGGLTSQQRCQAVTANLNRAVSSSGGRLSRLSLTSGTINSSPVICFISSRDAKKACTSTNIIMTLRPEDDPKEILQQIKDFSIRANTPAITRGEQNNEIYDFGLAVERVLNQPEATTTNPPDSTVP